MTWKKYEKEILKYFKETYPESEISFDKKIIGKYSKTERQIDILIEDEIAGYEIRIVVDCKFFSKNIDVKAVESFISMVEDLNAHQGVLITKKGFSKAAINRAFYGNQKVELDIINFDDLVGFQGLNAIPYTGHFAVILPSPFGWVLDWDDRINSFATLHQRGLTLKQAQKRNEWMYMNFWKRESAEFNLNHLIEIQNQQILEIDANSKFEIKTGVKRIDNFDTKICIADVSSYGFYEARGFIEFEDYIFFLVLFTPKELLEKNLRKMRHLLKVAVGSNISFNNEKVIQQRLEKILESDNDKEKANGYYQIGLWYQEMEDIDNAIINFDKALECFPTHYSILKEVIYKAISFGFYEKANEYAKGLFYSAPKNPRALQDLIDIFLSMKKSEMLIEFFNNEIKENKDQEILGNLNFHLGLTYMNLGLKNESIKSMKIAKSHFQSIFGKEHYVFDSIKNFSDKYK